MPKDIHMLVSMINMKLRDDDMQLSHVLSIYDLDETDFMKRLVENDYYYDESTNQIVLSKNSDIIMILRRREFKC